MVLSEDLPPKEDTSKGAREPGLPPEFMPDQTPPSPAPLIPEYAPAPSRQDSKTLFAGRMAIGCLGYVLLTALWFIAFARGARMPGLGFGGWFLITVGLLGLTLWLRLRYGIKGYGYGILAAIMSSVLLCVGLVLLMIALCARGGKL